MSDNDRELYRTYTSTGLRGAGPGLAEDIVTVGLIGSVGETGAPWVMKHIG